MDAQPELEASSHGIHPLNVTMFPGLAKNAAGKLPNPSRTAS